MIKIKIRMHQSTWKSKTIATKFYGRMEALDSRARTKIFTDKLDSFFESDRRSNLKRQSRSMWCKKTRAGFDTMLNEGKKGIIFIFILKKNIQESTYIDM